MLAVEKACDRKSSHRPGSPLGEYKTAVFNRQHLLLGRDPLETDTNLYRYCDNNPVNATDPMGLATINCSQDFCKLMQQIYAAQIQDSKYPKDENDCIRIPYKDFKNILQQQHSISLTDAQISALRWGCIGMNILFQRDFNTPIIERPLEQGLIPAFQVRAKCWKKRESMEIAAKAMKCDEGDHKQIFAIQGSWKNGKEPGEGWVSPGDVIDSSKLFNYINICDNDFSVGMTECAYKRNDPLTYDDQMSVVLCPNTKKIQSTEKFPALLWCLRCVPCNKPS